ncbi:MAG: hypothetical protein M0D54_16810 [Hyphomonadaceae bacterium JAD_PAG50586_4]|nr:MAG: hypothetical protein M0D54_16810 [Hyphomonadaceae bacterium JAD_PAG50586_4]
MPKFMALYVGSPEAFARSGWDKLDDTTRKAREITGMQAWGEWQEKNKSVMVDEGSPLGKTKRVDAKGLATFPILSPATSSSKPLRTMAPPSSLRTIRTSRSSLAMRWRSCRAIRCRRWRT